VADNRKVINKRKRNEDDYLSCSAVSNEKTVELKTEDIAVNSKRTMTILNDYVNHITNHLNDEEYYDIDLENLENTDITNYNLQIYQDDNVYYSFVFKTQNQSYFYIIPIHDSKGNLYLPKGQMEITFVKEGKRYGFDASVVDFKDNLLKIKRETKYYKINMRREDRIKVNIPALVFVNEAKYDAAIVNINNSGALIQIDACFAIGLRIALEFVLNDTKMVMFADVVRTQTINQKPYLGLKFVGGLHDNNT